MSASRLPFHPGLESAFQLGALTVYEAWYLERVLESETEFNQFDLKLITWVQLINCPPEFLTLQ